MAGRPVVVAAFLLMVCGVSAQQPRTHSTEKLGTVHFETSCAAAAQPHIDRAVALLHSFDFQRAIGSFTAAGAADASCGIASWSVALSLWTNRL